jgi:hypothetical protein
MCRTWASTRGSFDAKAMLADLRVHDEPRYHYVSDVSYLERAYTLRDIVGARGQLRKKRIVGSLARLVVDRLRGRERPVSARPRPPASQWAESAR